MDMKTTVNVNIKLWHHFQNAEGIFTKQRSKPAVVANFVVTTKGTATSYVVRIQGIGGVYPFSAKHGWSLDKLAGMWRIDEEDLKTLAQTVIERGFQVELEERDRPVQRGATRNPEPKSLGTSLTRRQTALDFDRLD